MHGPNGPYPSSASEHLSIPETIKKTSYKVNLLKRYLIKEDTPLGWMLKLLFMNKVSVLLNMPTIIIDIRIFKVVFLFTKPPTDLSIEGKLFLVKASIESYSYQPSK